MHLFTYGTLQYAEVIEAVLGRRPERRRGRAAGLVRYGVRHACYPGALSRPGCWLTGIVWRDLQAAEWWQLDRFEGSLYQRTSCIVHDGDGAYPAAVYVVPDSRAAALTGQPWDERYFREEAWEDYLSGCRIERPVGSPTIRSRLRR